MALSFAFIISALFSYPAWLYERIRHPVVWMGAGIARLERECNRPELGRISGYLSGIGFMVGSCIVIGVIALELARCGKVVQVVVMVSLLATRSLYDHVMAVYKAKDLDEAREKVAHIVGRDVAALDAAEVNRAALESLAESFSDGVVAPLFWAACYGLPGIACYKFINTADSMIGHKDERYRHFGWAAARLDDVANLIPARVSGVLIAVAARSSKALRVAWRDAGKHPSPNAGWPESAMAGALGVQLGGTNYYNGVAHDTPAMGDGTKEITSAHLAQGLRIYVVACAILLLGLLVRTVLHH